MIKKVYAVCLGLINNLKYTKPEIFPHTHERAFSVKYDDSSTDNSYFLLCDPFFTTSDDPIIEWLIIIS